MSEPKKKAVRTSRDLTEMKWKSELYGRAQGRIEFRYAIIFPNWGPRFEAGKKNQIMNFTIHSGRAFQRYNTRSQAEQYRCFQKTKIVIDLISCSFSVKYFRMSQKSSAIPDKTSPG